MQISQSNLASAQSAAAQPTVRGAQAGAAAMPARGAAPLGATAAVGQGPPPPGPPQGPPPGGPDAVVARLDAYGAGIASRIESAFAGAQASGADTSALEGAVGRFDQSLSRIRSGIEDGSLRGEDLARAVQNSVSMVQADLKDMTAAKEDQDVMDAAVTDAADGAALGASQTGMGGSMTPAAAAQGRFQSIVQGMGQRLSGLVSGAKDEDSQGQLKAAQDAFTSATSRIETSFFEGGDFDRGTFYGLMSASLGRLQQRVSDVQSGTQASEARLYSAKNGTESLSEGLRRINFDTTA
ncbi:MAG: hypothetical protein R3F49_00860 [Planctomycetota bacterium]